MPVPDNSDNNGNLIDQLNKLIAKLPRGEQLLLLNEIKGRLSNLNRKHLRKILSTRVEYSTKDCSDKGVIHDISNGGIFIETRMPFRSEEDIYLNFTLPEAPDIQIKIHGKIARISPNGIGVEFISLNREQEELIKSYLNRS